MTAEEAKTKIKELEAELARVEGTKCEVYSRVVGYCRPVSQWNVGKQEEFRERKVFEV